MKKLVIQKSLPFLLLGLFFAFSGFTFSDSDEAIVKIDGKQILPEGTVTLERDDTILLEVEGVKPNSTVDFKVKKMGIRWAEDSYEVDETGKIKAILDIPENKITLNCFVSYYTADNVFKTVEFKFKVV